MKSLIIHPEADADACVASEWYERHGNLGDEFMTAVAATIEKFLVDPSSQERIRGNFRRRRVEKFPYDVIFEDLESSIVVIAIAHHHRQSNYWRRRRTAD